MFGLQRCDAVTEYGEGGGSNIRHHRAAGIQEALLLRSQYRLDSERIETPFRWRRKWPHPKRSRASSTSRVAILSRKQTSIKPLESRAPTLVTVHQHLRVALGAENVAPPFELMPEFGMVENLARRCKDDLTILIRQRLPTTYHVHDVQPDMCEAYLPAGVESVTIRSPVSDRGGHPTSEGRETPLGDGAQYSYAAH